MNTEAVDFDDSSITVPDGALFVAADEPMLVFPSVAAAEKYLEAVYVASGVHTAAYGPEGQTYRITNEGKRVVIERTGDPDRPDALKMLLLHYLEANREPIDVTMCLGKLVAEVWTLESDFWQERDPYGDRFASKISPWGCMAFVIVVATVLYFVFR